MTPVQSKLLEAIRDNTVDGISPSYGLLAQKMGWVSKGNVFRVLKLMRADGVVEWDPRRRNSLRILADGPSRAAMDRWSDDEVARVQLDLIDIARRRQIARILASPTCPALERG